MDFLLTPDLLACLALVLLMGVVAFAWPTE